MFDAGNVERVMADGATPSERALALVGDANYMAARKRVEGAKANRIFKQVTEHVGALVEDAMANGHNVNPQLYGGLIERYARIAARHLGLSSEHAFAYTFEEASVKTQTIAMERAREDGVNPIEVITKLRPLIDTGLYSNRMVTSFLMYVKEMQRGMQH
jgi:hypothetical protein